MEARSVAMIKIQALHTIDGEVVAEVNCDDYDDFHALPDAIEVEVFILGKTGWSSDRNYACYKQNVILGKIVDYYA
jgi:hypothetical protein